jgi:hypothetical protein
MSETKSPNERLEELKRRYHAKTPEEKWRGFQRLIEFCKNEWKEPAEMEAKEAANYLLENGLLFEINRRVLHPFGLAMSLVCDDVTKEPTGEFGIVRTDDLEGICFDAETYKGAQAKFMHFMQHEGGAARMAHRITHLGFVVQTTEHVKRVSKEVEPVINENIDVEGCE